MAACRLVTLDVTGTCMKVTRSVGYHYVSYNAVIKELKFQVSDFSYCIVKNSARIWSST